MWLRRAIPPNPVDKAYIAFRRNANQSIPNIAWTTILFDTIFVSQGITYNVATGIFTVLDSGFYSVSVGINWAANGVGIRGIQITATGLIYFWQIFPTIATVGVGSTANINHTLRLNASNTISIQGYQSSGAALLTNVTVAMPGGVITKVADYP